MVRDDVLTLLSETYSRNSIGAYPAETTEKTIFCRVESISQTEFFDAGGIGLHPAYKFRVLRYEYNGEELVKYHGAKYHVYRTWAGTGDDMELYVEEVAGKRGQSQV